jgi:hypothetical protein
MKLAASQPAMLRCGEFQEWGRKAAPSPGFEMREHNAHGERNCSTQMLNANA